MANEITTVAKLTATKSGVTATGDTTKLLTMSGSQIWQATASITTTVEALVFPGDLTTEGISYLWLKNLDATNYVTLGTNFSGANVTQQFAILKAGEIALFRVYTASPTYYAQANGGTILLQQVAIGATT